MRHSIVIPVHDEPCVDELTSRFLAALPPAVTSVLHEVILVENGSTDGTLEACRRLAARHPHLVRVVVGDRASYGEAIRRGMLECRGSHLSILECDFLDVAFVERSIGAFRAGSARFLVASKRHPDSVDERPARRRLLTWGFNRILNALVGYPGSDTHGLKSIEAGLARQLCELAVTTDEVFQTEIVLIAWKLGVRIHELPIEIREVRPTPVAIARRVPKVLNIVGELRRSMRRFSGGASTVGVHRRLLAEYRRTVPGGR